VTLARLYGRVQGHGSLAVVTDGFRSVLDEEGLLAGICPLDVAEVPEEESHAGASARHGIFTGPLGQVGDMFKRGLHQHYWIMLAPNSNRLPSDLVRLITGYAERFPRQVHLMAPSAWAADVVSKHFDGHYIDIVHSVPHGVSAEYHHRQDLSSETREAFERGDPFRVMHFSTSAQRRKGTVELIQAWLQLSAEGPWEDARLLCVMDRQAQLSLMDTLWELNVRLPDSVRVVDRADLPAVAMAKNLQRAHLVCQPSRGEAFGLIPLEALCCGVPVVATTCTGHSEYYQGRIVGTPTRSNCAPGFLTIPTGDLAPLDDLPGSMAPSLDSKDVAAALSFARHCWATLQEQAIEAAPMWQSNWSWKVSLGPFVELLRNT
jgi:glycosyltransferase involved in cell wall biosynthesis